MIGGGITLRRMFLLSMGSLGQGITDVVFSFFLVDTYVHVLVVTEEVPLLWGRAPHARTHFANSFFDHSLLRHLPFLFFASGFGRLELRDSRR